jgi:hypothetical protein
MTATQTINEFVGSADVSRIYIDKINGNWVIGRVANFAFQAKVFELPSDDYGMNGGRVSKLLLRNEAGSCVVNYDRGWDVRPAWPCDCEAMEIVLAAFA